MASISDIRAKYPQYSDLSDEDLAHGLHDKFYSDMPWEQFASKVDFKSESGRGRPDAPPPPPRERAAWEGQVDASNAVGTMVSGAVAGIPASVASLYSRITGGDHDKVKSDVQDALTYEGTPESQKILSGLSKTVGRATAPIHNAGRAVADAINTLPGGEIATDIIGNAGGTAMDVLGAYPAAGAGAGLARATANTAGRVTGGLERIAGAHATKIARNAAGESRAAIEASLAKADPSLNAGQASADVVQPTWQALASLAERQAQDPFYHKQGLEQAAGRAKALEGVTPNLDEATKARSAASGPLYEQAKAKNLQLTPEAKDVLARMPQGILQSAEELARVSGKDLYVRMGDKPMAIRGDAIQYLKLALDDAGKFRPNATAAEETLSRAAREYKPAFLETVERQIPEFGKARKAHAALSPPVNQSEVLGEISKTLRNSAGGNERVGPLLTQLDKAPDSVLKKATGQSRYTGKGLDEVLTPDQLAAVDKVKAELLRDEQMGAQSRAGTGGLSRTMNAGTFKYRIPALFSPKVTVLNKALSIGETKLNARVLDKLVAGMKSGESARALLAGLPPAERSQLLSFLKVTPRNLAASAASTATSEQQ